MDYIQVATRIAGAEDPYAEFEKEASPLNEIEKTSLARALNKQMFLAKLDNRNGDGHLDFDLVVPETIGTHVSKSDTDSNMSKTASTISVMDKSLLITDDMFVLESRNDKSYSTPYDTSDLQAMTIDTANRVYEDNMIKTAEELKAYKIEKRAEIEDSIPGMLEQLVKIARDPSEARTLIMHVVDAKQEDLVSSIVSMSQSRESDISDASLCDLGEDKVAQINGILDEIADKKKMYEDVSNIEVIRADVNDAEIDKVAIPILKPALWMGKKLFGAAAKVAGKTAGAAVYMAKSPKAAFAASGVGGALMSADAHKEKILRQIM